MLVLISSIALLSGNAVFGQDAWAPPIDPPGDGGIDELAFDSEGIYLLGDDLYRSDDNLLSFTQILDEIGEDIHFDGGNLYFSEFIGGIAISDDRGQSWQFPFDLNTEAVTAAGDAIWTGGLSAQLFRSVGGSAFIVTNCNMLALTDEDVLEIVANGSFAVASLGLFRDETYAWDGTQWQLISGLEADDLDFDSDYFWAADGTSIFRSTDGLAWELFSEVPISFGIDSFDVMGEVFIVAGSLGGVVVSDDGGSSWRVFESGLFNDDPFFVAIGPDGHGYATYLFDDVIQRTVEPISGSMGTPISNAEPLPDQLDLEVYPNPSAGRLSLDLQLSQPGHVELTVFDSAGREVDVILNRSAPVGRFQVSHENKLPTGTYFIQLRTDSGSITRKVTLIR